MTVAKQKTMHNHFFRAKKKYTKKEKSHWFAIVHNQKSSQNIIEDLCHKSSHKWKLYLTIKSHAKMANLVSKSRLWNKVKFRTGCREIASNLLSPRQFWSLFFAFRNTHKHPPARWHCTSMDMSKIGCWGDLGTRHKKGIKWLE